MKKILYIFIGIGTLTYFSVAFLYWWICSLNGEISHFYFWLCILAVYFSVAIIFVICAVAALPYKTAQKNAKPVETPAKVFSKAMNNGRYMSSYYIAFLLPGGKRKNFIVSVEQYNTVAENEEGILTYKKYKRQIWFVSFRPTVVID